MRTVPALGEIASGAPCSFIPIILIMNMDEFSTVPSRRGSKFRWLSVLVSVGLWMLAFELILWFLPIQPRLIIRTDNLEAGTSEDVMMGFSPDGRLLVTSVVRDPALPGAIYHLWDTTTGEQMATVGNEETNLLPNIVYTSQTDLLEETFFPGRLGIVTLYDLATHQETICIEVRRDLEAVTALCFSSDGRTLVYCTNTQDKGDLRLIDVATGQVRAHLKGGKYGDFAGLVLSQDGSALATTETKPSPDDNADDEEKIIVLDTTTGMTRRVFQECGDIPSLSLSPDGTKLAAYCMIRNSEAEDGIDRQIRIWDLSTGEQVATFKARGFPQFLADGALAIRDRDDDSVRFCNPITGKEFAVAKTPPSCLTTGPGRSTGLFSIPGTHLLGVAACHHSTPPLFLKWCTIFLGIKGLGEEKRDDELAFIDTRTGETVAAIIRPSIVNVEIFPDGKTSALEVYRNDESIIEIWDIPPRRPLRWVLGLLAIPSVVTLITLARWWKSG